MIGKTLYAISYQKNIYAVRVIEHKKRDEEVYQIITEIAEPELIEREDLYHFNDSVKSVNYSKTNTLEMKRLYCKRETAAALIENEIKEEIKEAEKHLSHLKQKLQDFQK